MTDSFVVAAQVSTSDIPSGLATAEWVWRAIDRVTDILPLDILVIGGHEAPEVFRDVTARSARPARHVYLWYDLLSGYPGGAPAEQVIGWRGVTPEGWGDEADEAFRFGCPNNPAVQRKALRALSRLVGKYPFDGIFLDKLRFPSPANGLDGLFTCFCRHCIQSADAAGLDLDAVRAALNQASHADAGGEYTLPPGAPWLDDLLRDQSLLRAFARFRADSITELVGRAGAIAHRAGLTSALDLFAPVLAPLVGQDYPALAAGAAWVKPMTYRLTAAPAGLRLELPALAGLLGAHLGRSPDDVLAWARLRLPSLGDASLRDIAARGLPPELIEEELARAVQLSAPTPVYMGLETVSIPDICEATPATVTQAILAGRRAGVAGLVMSWDLLDTPLENVRAVAEALSQD